MLKKRICFLLSFRPPFPKHSVKLRTSSNKRQGSLLGGKSDHGQQSYGKWLMLVFPVGGVGLGVWQIKRKAWKLELIATLDKKTKSDPISFPEEIADLNSLEYRPLVVKGVFDHSRELYIEPRSLVQKESGKAVDAGSLMSIKNKNIGLQVITPFFIPDRNLAILVNRGFVFKDKKDPRTRIGGQIDGIVEITGVLRLNEKRPPLVPKNDPKRGQWNYKDLEQMAKITGTSPILLDCVDTVPGGPIGGQTRVTMRDEHIQYAITWFSLAIVTSVSWYIRFIK